VSGGIANTGSAIVNAGNAGMMATAVGLLCILGIKTVMARTMNNKSSSLGSARWAERRDIEAAGLLPRKLSPFERIRGKTAPFSGVYVGAFGVDSENGI
jgi:type IV secretion system protein VirD4